MSLEEYRIALSNLNKTAFKVKAGNKYLIRIESGPGNILVKICDDPIVNTRYEINIQGQPNISGSTDGLGQINFNPAGECSSFKLVLYTEPQMEFTIEIGEFKSIDEVTGIKQRLRNLGYDPGSITDSSDDKYVSAVKGFQYNTNLETDGIAGSKTKAKLQEIYGY
jgi:hypothetical protein